MKLISLRLKGFTGISRGLGLDEIELDLSNVSGLVSISGDNGTGKTTILESMNPYRTFFSKTSSLYKHVFLRDSFSELIFEFNDNVYRTLVNIDSKTGYSEAFIYKNGNPESLVDGKVKSYDTFISNLLGTKSLFENSVFCAQNATPISDLTTSEFKNLLTEMLPIEKLSIYESITKSCIKIVDGIHTHTVGSIEQLENRLEKLNNVEKTSKENKISLAEYLQKKEKEDIDFKELTKDYQKLESILIENDLSYAKINNSSLKADEFSIDIARLYDDQKENEKSFQSSLANIEDDESLNEAIVNNEKTISSAKTAIIDEEAQLLKLKKHLDDFENRKSTSEKDIIKTETHIDKSNHLIELDTIGTKIQKLISDIDLSERDLTTVAAQMLKSNKDPEIMILNNKIIDALEKSKMLDARDEDCKSTTCIFIKNFIDAKNSIDGLKIKLSSKEKLLATERISLEKKHDKIKENLLMLRKEFERKKGSRQESINIENENILRYRTYIQCCKLSIEGLEVKIDLCKTNIAQAKIKIKDLQVIASDESRVENAKENIKTLARRKNEIIETIENHRIKSKGYINEKKDKITNIKLDIFKFKNTIDKDAYAKSKEIGRNISRCERRLNEINKTVNLLNNKNILIEATIKEKDRLDVELKSIESKKVIQEKEISHWTYLRNACSKNGLQSLEIDGASPMIAAYSNRLLFESIGEAMSLKIITQDPETGREILDIVVIREDGSETYLQNLSGGEKVFILKALRLAITLVHNEKSDKNYMTFFSDEEDGALSNENAIRFINLYRSLMTIGNFNTGFYISHNKNVIDMADYSIHLSQDGISIS